MAAKQSIKSQIQQQTRHLLTTGNRFTRFDQIRQRHFWSSYYFQADANGYINQGTFPIFVTPAGSNGQGFPNGTVLTDRETNWKSQNRVPDNQNFEITELGVSIGIATTDLQPVVAKVITANPDERVVASNVFSAFLAETILSITYLTNSVPLGKCSDFGQASAPQPGNIGGGGVQFRSNGMPAPGLRRKFKIPILLQHGETFAFAFEIPRSFFIGPLNESLGTIVARMDFWATESFVEKS